MRQVIEEIWNDGDLELADQVFALDYINHGGLIPDLVRGPEAIKVSVALYWLAFPSSGLLWSICLPRGRCRSEELGRPHDGRMMRRGHADREPDTPADDVSA